MKILCWNTDDAVWKHWNQIVGASTSLVRVQTLEDVYHALETDASNYQYCFIYLEDTSLPKQVEEVVALYSAFPNQKVIVFPNQLSQAGALRLFSVGISGQCAPYIGKEQLSLVLSVVGSGEIWGGKAFIQQLIMQSTAPAENHHVELDDLSERELDVAQHVAKGLSNKQIALEMDITERTVKAHLTSVFKKTNTKDRLALALLAQA
ncbi:DNA-binding response regulator [Marinomonas rhizomae]|uniref:DNA-binding NarL/FixJ family response regulator n=1 Tax=Marinomonas rhizomae TaxID=491948 RepID=A0A366JCS8_9GAMM|nr:response regulator transcription factor [Marinomonas rhizomae]RBP84189.1 DNA-binding NarL/FixJ family response regulator [Marinomonas rhizomae]RNF74519.1 DNA-binding response regulator [Marinomonas rhizomae]